MIYGLGIVCVLFGFWVVYWYMCICVCVIGFVDKSKCFFVEDDVDLRVDNWVSGGYFYIK